MSRNTAFPPRLKSMIAILGVVMNKADMGVLGRYERYRSNYYYRKYYSRYGYTA